MVVVAQLVLEVLEVLTEFIPLMEMAAAVVAQDGIVLIGIIKAVAVQTPAVVEAVAL